MQYGTSRTESGNRHGVAAHRCSRQSADCLGNLGISPKCLGNPKISSPNCLGNLGISSPNYLSNLGISGSPKVLGISSPNCLDKLGISSPNCLGNLEMTTPDCLDNLEMIFPDCLGNLEISPDCLGNLGFPDCLRKSADCLDSQIAWNIDITPGQMLFWGSRLLFTANGMCIIHNIFHKLKILFIGYVGEVHFWNKNNYTELEPPSETWHGQTKPALPFPIISPFAHDLSVLRQTLSCAVESK